MLHFQFHTYVFVSLLVYHHQFHTIIFVLLSIYLPLFYTVLQYQFHTYVFVSLSIYLPLFYTHSASVSVSSDLFLDIDNLFNNLNFILTSLLHSHCCTFNFKYTCPHLQFFARVATNVSHFGHFLKGPGFNSTLPLTINNIPTILA